MHQAYTHTRTDTLLPSLNQFNPHYTLINPHIPTDAQRTDTREQSIETKGYMECHNVCSLFFCQISLIINY